MRKKNRKTGKMIVLGLLGLLIFVAVFADFIANDEALLCRDVDGSISYPAFSQHSATSCEAIINAPIQYKYNNIDELNANYIGPFDKQKLKTGQQRHFLGTDQLGRDVSSGLIHGSRVALLTGSLSMAIALFIGLLLGLISGYYGNDQIKIKRNSIIILLLVVFAIWYIIAYWNLFFLSWSYILLFFSILIFLIIVIKYLLGRIPWFSKKINMALDLGISNFTEIFQSLPGSFIILILVSLFAKASLINVILVIGLLRWPLIARYVRAEMLKIKAQRYIESSKAIGMKDWRIILRHALPASLTPVIVAVSFGFASAILLESALSFLGIGLPADHVSFGSMLSEARRNYEAWWLAVFPGLAIFLLVYIFNYLGDLLSRQIDKK